MQPDLSVRAEITFLLLIALQYLGCIVANVKEKAKVITLETICQRCKFNTVTTTQNKGAYMSYMTQTDYQLNTMTEDSFF